MVDELLILDAAEGWSPVLLVGVAPDATQGQAAVTATLLARAGPVP